MTETTAEDQMETWKNELSVAMADEQWRRALQLCSWLRYTLGQDGLTDPQVEMDHRRAKEGLTELLAHEEAQRKDRQEQQRRRAGIIDQIDSGQNKQALESIESLVEDGAGRREVIQLLTKLRTRMGRVLAPGYREMSLRASMLGTRLDELEARVRGE